jgi:hypothetical protein
MKKPLILFAACLTLAVAAKPGARKLDYDSSVFGLGSDRAYAPIRVVETARPVREYPPCRSRSDDNCIQMYERRVRAAAGRPALPRLAVGGPIEGPADYPHCSRVITDECVQAFDRTPYRGTTRRAAPPHRRPAAAKGDENTPGL